MTTLCVSKCYKVYILNYVMIGVFSKQPSKTLMKSMMDLCIFDINFTHMFFIVVCIHRVAIGIGCHKHDYDYFYWFTQRVIPNVQSF